MSTYSGAKQETAFKLSQTWVALDSNHKRLILVSFIEILAVSCYSAVLMPYYRSLGHGAEVAGALTSIIQVVSAAVAVTAGFLADSLGRKRLYTAGQLLRCAAAGLLMVTRSYIGLALVSVLRGLATVQSPAQSAMLASYTRTENRGTLYGLTQTFSQMAQVTGPLIAGMVADRFGVMTSFGGGLLLASVAVAIAVPLKDKSSTTAKDSVATADTERVVAENAPRLRESPATRIARMFRENRPAVLSALLVTGFSNGLANGATNILLPFTIMDRFSSAYTTVSSSQAVGALGTMLVLLIGGRIADIHGRRGLVLISGAVFPTLMLGLFMVNSLWQLLALIVLITMVGNISSPAISAVYTEAVGEGDRATFAGLHMGLNSGGSALGMIAGGVAYKINPTYAWAAVIVLFALQLPLYAIGIPREHSK